jgi:hypothetical protein
MRVGECPSGENMVKKSLEELKLKATKAQQEVKDAEVAPDDYFTNCLEVKLDDWAVRSGLNYRAACHMMVEYLRCKGLEENFRKHLETQ